MPSSRSPRPPKRTRFEPVVTEREKRRRRREGLLIVAAGIAVVVFALWEIRRPGATDSAAGNVFSFFVVNLNIILLLLLVFLVLRNVLRLYIDRRRQVPGSRLRSRLVLAFASIAVFPAAVMLLISLEFSTNAIDDWFNSEVEDSLLGAWRLAQTYYRETADRSQLHAQRLSEAIASALPESGAIDDAMRAELEARVAKYQSDYGLGAVQVFDSSGATVLFVSGDRAPDAPPLGADLGLFERAREGKPAIRVEALGGADVVRAAAVVRGDGGAIRGLLIADSIVDESARAWSERALTAFREYRKLKINKRPFKNLYVLTMALASLVVVFSATWLGLYLARGITEPLGRLADATRRVAAGDWDVELADEGGDEVGTLVGAFNAMTADLKTSHAALEERRRYIENILAHIDAGVIAVDGEGKVTAVNPAAVSQLGAAAGGGLGVDAREMFQRAGYPEVADLLHGLVTDRLTSGARRSVVRESEGRTLVATATALESSDDSPRDYVLFFEDVSQIAAAQRMQAWREVARRIAHEIKNPLTPIQLSAQRVERKLAAHLPRAEREILEDATRTIVSQVEELKRLVNEFGQFARQAQGEKRLHDLNALVEETLPLFSQSRPEISMRFEADTSLPSVEIHRESVKRALINLLDNAVAAVSGEIGGADATARSREIVVRTRYDAALARVCLEVLDSGPGVPVEARSRIFEPYYSTRTGGTGLGLAIVASIAADHRAFVRYYDNTPTGSRFVVEFPASSRAVEV
jgi:two-component system nitrogen regulation sensor histidine kinase NtrY